VADGLNVLTEPTYQLTVILRSDGAWRPSRPPQNQRLV